jgi:hypothetical protein
MNLQVPVTCAAAYPAKGHVKGPRSETVWCKAGSSEKPELLRGISTEWLLLLVHLFNVLGCTIGGCSTIQLSAKPELLGVTQVGFVSRVNFLLLAWATLSYSWT